MADVIRANMELMLQQSVIAADRAVGGMVTFSIVGGSDAPLFAIDTATGQLSFITAPDVEVPADTNGDNVYDVIVAGSDGSMSSSQAIAVTVTDSNGGTPGAPSVATAPITETATAAPATSATDLVAGRTITFSIAGQADAARFKIDAATGAVTVLAAPGFELPSDADVETVYRLTLGGAEGVTTSTQAPGVAVERGLAASIIAPNRGRDSAPIAPVEAATVVTTILTIAIASIVTTGTDGEVLRTFEIVGGADAASFQIDAATGALTFVEVPNFEAPADVGGSTCDGSTVEAADGAPVHHVALAGMPVSGGAEANAIGSALAGRNAGETLAGSRDGDDVDAPGRGDTDVVDHQSDVMAELNSMAGGTDDAQSLSSIYVSADANIDNATFIGVGNFTGAGNRFDNVISGGAANDALDGGSGTGTLNGGGGVDAPTGSFTGHDVQIGGAGNDTMAFAAGFGSDAVIDFDVDAAGGEDLLNLPDAGIDAGSFSSTVFINSAGGSPVVTVGTDAITVIGVDGAGDNVVSIDDFRLLS